jgi:hypothetical protein
MKYVLCQFQYGYDGTFYQKMDQFGISSFYDMDGNPLTLEAPYGYFVIDENPPRQPWMV